jgi:hypothetical protein
MIKELLKRAIEQKNAFMTEDMIQLQIEFFTAAGKLTEDDKAELLALLPASEPES